MERIPSVLPPHPLPFMSPNQISVLSPTAFHNTNTLHHLDLLFSRLHMVGKHPFQDLLGLEILRLYNNLITNVESNALMGQQSQEGLSEPQPDYRLPLFLLLEAQPSYAGHSGPLF